MTWNPQEVADRLEIVDTLTRYSDGLDQRNWLQWDRTFTADATIDFSTVGIGVCTPAELREILSRSDPVRISAQHLLSNVLIDLDLDGDRAAVRAEYSLTTLARTEVGGSQIRFVRGGGCYEDDLRRTSDGWRIAYRRAIQKWMRIEELDESALLGLSG